jgi:hypothetical protein
MHRPLLAALAAFFALAPASLAGPAAPSVPGEIAVPEGHKPFLVGHATGVQIYACDGAAWRLVAPRATLTGDNGKLIATHGAGPHWTARDGSTVIGRRDAGVSGGAGAIDWLRLAVVSATPGDDGDRLAHTSYIQRINTTGGVAPAGSCADGARAEVPYTADYVFFKAAE